MMQKNKQDYSKIKTVIPKVSIIIACYDDPDVVKAVDSAKNQAYTNKEIILVDDGSGQTVANLIDGLKSDVDLILTQNNSGQSIARNNGIERATGLYIVNLDSDDFFEPSFCEKGVEVMQNDPEVKIVTCKARRFNYDGEIDIYTPAGGDYENFLTSNSAMGSAMFRRTDWESCGKYETVLPILGFEDWELYLNILKNGGRAAVLDEVLFNYQVRENSTTAKIKHIKQEKYRQIVFKHKDLFSKHFDLLVNELFDRVKKEEEDKNKIADKLDYRLGKHLLNPLRYIKGLLR